MGKVLTTEPKENLYWEQMKVWEEKGSAYPSITSRGLSSASELHLTLCKMKTKSLMGLETPFKPLIFRADHLGVASLTAFKQNLTEPCCCWSFASHISVIVRHETKYISTAL